MKENKYLPLYFLGGAMVSSFIGGFFELGTVAKYVFYGITLIFWILTIVFFVKYIRRS